MKKRSFWDVLAWIVLFLIVLWLIFKVLGLIKTRVLIEYAPYFGAAYLVGWHLHKLEVLCQEPCAKAQGVIGFLNTPKMPFLPAT